MAMGTQYTEQDRKLLVDSALEGAELKVCGDTGKEYYHMFKAPSHIAHEVKVRTAGRLRPSGKVIHKYVRERLFPQGLGYKSFGSTAVKWPPEDAPQPVAPGAEAASEKTVVTKDGRVLVLPSLETTDYLIALLENHKKELLNAV